jgi:hypothetical protein
MSTPVKNKSCAKEQAGVCHKRRAPLPLCQDLRRKPWRLQLTRGASALNESARRKLATVADHARALAEAGKLHLLQERHADGDYSYWAVARALVRGGQA